FGFIFNAAYQLTTIKNNHKNIHLATERASKIVFALKSYIHQQPTDTMQKSSITESLNLVLTLYQNQIKRGIEVTKKYESVPSLLCYA
ncbi:MAG: hybrid sensor histidine kinase/response regulator, partial [Cyanobacteria bacterium P01_G01_bin.49]